MIYQYRCQLCGKEVEVNHGMTEDPEVSCPTCGSEMTRRITGGAGTIFKGSGFPGNDMKKKERYFREQQKTEAEMQTKKPWEVVR